MTCFNVDLEIGFNFEFGNTQRTLVKYEFLEARASLEAGLLVTQSVTHSLTHSLTHTLGPQFV